ncbi:hypothetical protein SVAN01_09359 [Stagonosporopsis vannaccii]|nr:hypothetical protein SVAN01_09359 [Stagonosporopsis vannaccii]
MHLKFHDLEDATPLPTASLLRVLEGVAVATKAPEGKVRILSETIRHARPEAICYRSSEISPKAITDIGLQHPSFTQWRQLMTDAPEINEDGVRELAQVTFAVGLLRERARRNLVIDTASLDKIWNLIYDAIISASGAVLQFTVARSAQGFFSIPLCSLLEKGHIDELWRLHAWMPDNQRGAEEVCIHAHQPFGQSWTLLGSGTDHTFEVDKPDDPSLATHAAYEPYYLSESGKQSTGASGYQTFQIASTVRNTGKLLRVKPITQSSHSRDMTYSVPGGVYHKSDVPGHRLHATLFVFDSQRGFDINAAVIGPKHGWEYIQSRDPAGLTAEVIAQIVHATRRWEQRYGTVAQGDKEHPTPLAYYKLFRGLGLLRAGRRDDATQYLKSTEGDALEQVFSQEPSQEHHHYIQELRQLGLAI